MYCKLEVEKIDLFAINICHLSDPDIELIFGYFMSSYIYQFYNYPASKILNRIEYMNEGAKG